jgi:Methylase involved in ubiquinone/menaquinone biosynthesis
VGFHTFDADRADGLDDPERFRYCSREELLQHLPAHPERLLDLGSGTGFYTEEIAPYAETVYAVDIQQAMHDRYRVAGTAENVRLVTADADRLPFAAGAIDAAISTVTFHESATTAALADLAQVLDGPFVVVDWAGDGEGAAGPPVEERFTLAEARRLLDAAGFEIHRAADRSETFLIVAAA